MDGERRSVAGREDKVEKPARKESTAVRGPERQKDGGRRTGIRHCLVDLVKKRQAGPMMFEVAIAITKIEVQEVLLVAVDRRD